MQMRESGGAHMLTCRAEPLHRGLLSSKNHFSHFFSHKAKVQGEPLFSNFPDTLEEDHSADSYSDEDSEPVLEDEGPPFPWLGKMIIQQMQGLRMLKRK